MDPFVLGYLVLALVLGLGCLIKRCSWSKPLAVLCYFVLALDSLFRLAKMLFRAHFWPAPVLELKCEQASARGNCPRVAIGMYGRYE